MDFEKPLNDLVSQCQSLGSNRRMSIQPRKISRGILVDSHAKFRPARVKEDAVVLTGECKNPQHVEEDGTRLQLVNGGNNGNRSEALKQERSLLSTRTSDKKISTSEVHDMSDGATEARLKFSANYANLRPGLGGNDKPQSQHVRVISESKDVNAEVTNKLSFGLGQPIMVEDRTDKAENGGTETLRISLFKILETVSSPQKQHTYDGNLKNDHKESDHIIQNKEEVYSVLKSIQRSDTIESDSDRPNQSLSRPTALPLGRKRVSSEVKRKRKPDPSLNKHKDKRRKKVSSRERFAAVLSNGNTGGSHVLKGKTVERQLSAPDTRKLLFDEQEKQGGSQQANSQRLSFMDTRGDNKGFYCWKNSEVIKLKSVGVGQCSRQCPLGTTSEHPTRVNESPTLQENVDCSKDLGHSSFKNISAGMSDEDSPIIKLQTITKSPTCSPHFGMKTSSKGLSSRSTFKNMSGLGFGELDDNIHLEISGMKGLKSFSRLRASRQNDDLSDSHKGISHTAGKLQVDLGMFATPLVVESAKVVLETMTEHSESEASEEDCDVQGCVESETFSSGNVLPANEASVLHKDKKRFHRDGFRVTGFASNLASEKRTSARHWDLPDQEDELARGVALFSLALERVKSKIKSLARKQSAEILMTVADKIQLQLQNAESHIQGDVGKLDSLCTSEKKRLETRCQDLQGELNIMHQRFKEEVYQHVENCKSTVEGLEEHQMELKATLERQRVSHRKLLLQAEEAIESDLIDAERRISAIQNFAKEKMLELKSIVANSLK